METRNKTRLAMRWAGIVGFMILLVGVGWAVAGNATLSSFTVKPKTAAVIHGEAECEEGEEVELKVKIQGTSAILSEALEVESEEFEGNDGTPLDECTGALDQLRELVKYSKDADCDVSEIHYGTGEAEFQFVCEGSISGLLEFLGEVIEEIIGVED